MSYDKNTVSGFTSGNGVIYDPDYDNPPAGAVIPVTTADIFCFLGIPEDTTPDNYAAAMDARDRAAREQALWMKERVAVGMVAAQRLWNAELAVNRWILAETPVTYCSHGSHGCVSCQGGQAPEPLRREMAAALADYLPIRRVAILKIQEWRMLPGVIYGLPPHCFSSRDETGARVGGCGQNSEEV